MNKATSIGPREAFQKLLAGNDRFVRETLEHGSGVGHQRRREVAPAQAPYAAVLCCADSRVSATLVFDAGLGDLFVCRNAGNQLDALTVGSLEFAHAEAGCSLIAILGHTSCGAITAAVEAAGLPLSLTSPNLADVVRRLLPPVLAARPFGGGDAQWVTAAGRLNVRLGRRDLLAHSALLDDAFEAGRLGVAGLWYDLASGTVEVLEEPDAPIA